VTVDRVSLAARWHQWRARLVPARPRKRREVEAYLEELQEYKECLIREIAEADSSAEEAIP